MARLRSLLAALLAPVLGTYYTDIWPFSSRPLDDAERFSCKPFLPKIFIETPPTADQPVIRDAMRKLDAYLTKRFQEEDIESLSVAVVTSEGPLFEKNWGVIRGNESETSPPTDSHASYRLASVSKLFAVLEGFILEQRGVLSWCVSPAHHRPHSNNHRR